MTGSRRPLPRWIDIGLIPVVNVILAFIVAGLVVLTIGVNPFHVVRVMLVGAFGYLEAIGYTLYYATNFVFAGLAVALAFHAGLFNIGAEGQAYVGGLGSALVVLAFDSTLSPFLLIVLAIAAAAAFGAAWALIPAYLHAYRGSHIVITTIMFNFIGAALMVYLLVNVLIAPGSMSPESREFAPSSHLPLVHDLLASLGIRIGPTPLNASIFLALLACALVWIFLWHTTWGFELRTMGHNPDAAVYAGVSATRMTIIAMCLSGALAGLIGVNEILGVHHRLILNFAAGYGFGGIAVALMGRNHPIGIGLASLLFATLYQGGVELALEIPALSHEMIVLIQGLVILFSGALSNLMRAWVDRVFAALVPAADPAAAVAGKS
jgi:simple sugar transport system permease protein